MRRRVHALAWCCAGAPFYSDVRLATTRRIGVDGKNTWEEGGMVQISLVSNHSHEAIGLFSLLEGRFFNEEITRAARHSMY